MRILHLTDFHYSPDKDNKADINYLVEALCKSLRNKKKIDYILFTGDLVFSGNKLEYFHESKEIFLDKILDQLGVSTNELFICCGNHDVHRNQEMAAIGTHFKEKITSNESLNQFVKDENESQFKESCKNINNFNDFIAEKSSVNYENSDDFLSHLYSVHKRIYENKTIGFAAINTGWRANSDEDKGSLLFPISNINYAIEKLAGCDCKILLCHHSMNDLNDFNQYEIEDIIYQKFHFLFSGHIHKRKQSVHITSNEGIFCCVSPATLNLKNNMTDIGYTILDINLDTYEVNIENNSYNRQDYTFTSSKTIPVQIPMGQEKKEQNEFRKTLKKRFKNEAENATDLFVASTEEGNKDFLELFTTPVVKTVPKAEVSNEKGKAYSYNFENLINNKNSIIVYGKDKSGKTSLLKKVLLESLSCFNEFAILPFYIDFNDYKMSGKQIKLINRMARYFEMSQNALKLTLKKYHCRILADNYDPNNELLNKELKAFIEEYENTSILATAQETIANIYDLSVIKDLFHETLYIYDITRREIRLLTKKWPNIPSDKVELVLENIIKIFKQIHIPYNYWTVSLFLWIFEKTNDFNFHNNVELIELYIDNILERQKIATQKNVILPYENLKAYLGEFAKHLIENNSRTGYCISYHGMVLFTEEYRRTNVRFVIETKDILNYLFDRGIFYKRAQDLFTFRLKGVFEYFIAYHMKSDTDFKNRIIDNECTYLGFANEIEMYAGFSKKDAEFLNTIYTKTHGIFNCINENYSKLGTIDQNLVAKLEEVFNMQVPILQIEESQQSPLAPSELDEINECLKPLENGNSDVEPKEILSIVEPSAANFEHYIFILSRVYRNIDLINDKQLINNIFDFLLESYCNLGFCIIDDKIEDQKEFEKNGGEDSLATIIELLTNFIPIIIQINLYDGVAQINLTRIIENKIDELKNNKKKNQFKLFLLYFLLIDLDVPKNINLIDKALDLIHIDILKSAILLKLYSYLMFKSYDKPKIEKIIRNKIQYLTKQMNKNINMGLFQKKLEEKRRQYMLKRK